VKRIADNEPPKEQQRDPRYRYSSCCDQTCIKDRISIWNASGPNEQIGWVSRCGKCYKPQGTPAWWSNAPRPFPLGLWERAVRASGHGTVYLKRVGAGLEPLDVAPGVTVTPGPKHRADNGYQPEEEDAPF